MWATSPDAIGFGTTVDVQLMSGFAPVGNVVTLQAPALAYSRFDFTVADFGLAAASMRIDGSG